MGPLLAAAIPAVGSLVGGILGFAGGERQNNANAQQAQLNRDFQERMSNTSYQRAVADMQKAGLNPALAYQQGGASAPQGNQAVIQNSLAQGASSAAQTAQIASGVAHTVAQIQKTQAETRQVDLGTRLTEMQAQWHNALLRNRSEREAALTGFHANPHYINLLQKQMEADLRLTDTHAEAGAYELPGLRNRANAENSWWKRHVAPYLNDAKSVIGIGTSLALPGAIRGGLTGAGKLLRTGKTVRGNRGNFDPSDTDWVFNGTEWISKTTGKAFRDNF